MTTDGSQSDQDAQGRDRRAGDRPSSHRTARYGVLLGPALFALIGAVLIILAIVFI
ncbi:hypothetical protein [Ornithinimicrobium cavernae]|uniref:hypothetical protein n=1 Tax=Ornithinimicrobium cavernae TaxID=2666047 RepID=UPI0012B16FC9|nr:hypothetical protein [Ornithinimicrobium cavernae]